MVLHLIPPVEDVVAVVFVAGVKVEELGDAVGLDISAQTLAFAPGEGWSADV